jgi:hypothetical protein
MKTHDERVLKLQKQLQSQQQDAVSLVNRSTNTTRNRLYKEKGVRLDISGFNNVLEIDTEQMVCRVEPRVSMQQLVTETLKVDFMPQVVPEFKGITVGGAINGCGIESSSHKCGLFHDSCLSYELLLGNGEIVTASRSEHSDLFHAINGSYGSLAIVLSATIQLVPAARAVTLRYSHYDTPQEAIQHLRSRANVDLIEAIVFSPRHAVVIEGMYSMEAKPKARTAFSPWFCTAGYEPEMLSLTDYLFRYDTGAFWMGSYVLRPAMLRRFIMEGICDIQCKPLSPEQICKLSQIKTPGTFLRAITYLFMGSQPLFRLLHRGEDWIYKHLIVQDFTLPEQSVNWFMEHILQKCPIFPLWLCPVQAASRAQIFSPNSGPAHDDLYINVGLYGLPSSLKSPLDLLCEVENKAQELLGRKWLYTNSTYSNEQFWDIYPKDDYEMLRNRYHASSFVSIDEKVL